MKRAVCLACLLGCVVLVGSLRAGTFVRVSVTGEVEFNFETFGALEDVKTGDPVTLSFLLNSDQFVDSHSGPTRGYAMKRDSFSIVFPTYTMPLVDPLPQGETPYLCLVDDDPAGDGFFLSTDVGLPLGVPLQHTGLAGSFISSFSATYGASELLSLDLLDALGTHDLSGLADLDWTIDNGSFTAVTLLFDSMTLELAVPWIDLGGSSTGLAGPPGLEVFGPLSAGSTTTIQVTDAPPDAVLLAWLAVNPAPFAALGGTVHAFPYLVQVPRVSDGAGSLSESFPWPAGLAPGIDVTLQFVVQDPSSIHGITLTNGQRWMTF